MHSPESEIEMEKLIAVLDAYEHQQQKPKPTIIEILQSKLKNCNEGGVLLDESKDLESRQLAHLIINNQNSLVTLVCDNREKIKVAMGNIDWVLSGEFIPLGSLVIEHGGLSEIIDVQCIIKGDEGYILLIKTETCKLVFKYYYRYHNGSSTLVFFPGCGLMYDENDASVQAMQSVYNEIQNAINNQTNGQRSIALDFKNEIEKQSILGYIEQFREKYKQCLTIDIRENNRTIDFTYDIIANIPKSEFRYIEKKFDLDSVHEEHEGFGQHMIDQQILKIIYPETTMEIYEWGYCDNSHSTCYVSEYIPEDNDLKGVKRLGYFIGSYCLAVARKLDELNYRKKWLLRLNVVSKACLKKRKKSRQNVRISEATLKHMLLYAKFKPSEEFQEDQLLSVVADYSYYKPEEKIIDMIQSMDETQLTQLLDQSAINAFRGALVQEEKKLRDELSASPAYLKELLQKIMEGSQKEYVASDITIDQDTIEDVFKGSGQSFYMTILDKKLFSIIESQLGLILKPQELNKLVRQYGQVGSIIAHPTMNIGQYKGQQCVYEYYYSDILAKDEFIQNLVSQCPDDKIPLLLKKLEERARITSSL